MTLTAREMTLAETGIIIDYFHRATPEYQEMLGVDPTRLPTPESWRERFARECALAIEKRNALYVIWLADDGAIGFSTSDKIVSGEQARMHLHITDPERRNSGVGLECVRRSVDIYFERLRLKQLFCEPNAFNCRQIARCRRPASNTSRRI